MNNMSNASVIRVEKNRNFTVMSNVHLKDKRLTLKSVGLLCKILSLPDEWEYSISGLVAICKEGRDAIRSALIELKQYGYVEINKKSGNNGQFYYEYVIHEIPKPVTDNPDTDSPDTENPHLDIPHLETPDLENPTQLNTNKLNTKELNINNTNSEENIPKGQLINIGTKLKKKKENQYITVIQEISKNESIREALQKYCDFRRGRGLTIDQWKLIVNKFKEDSKGKTVKEVINCIEQCIINGRNSLYYSQYNNNQTNNTQTQIECSTLKRSDQF